MPKFIFSETEAVYAGKTIDMLPKIKEIASDLSSKGLQHVILLPSIKTGLEPSSEVTDGVSLRWVFSNCCVGQSIMSALSKTLSTFLASDDGRPLMFEQLPFDQPLYILYSSGTTGPPKCIVHGAGVRKYNPLDYSSHGLPRASSFKRRKSSPFTLAWGLMIVISNILRYIYLLMPPPPKSPHRLQTAWMMWPYMLSGLACGSRIILYDGSPFYPDAKTYLRIVDEQEFVKSLLSIPRQLMYNDVFPTASHILVRAPASYLRFKVVESSLGVSSLAPPFRQAIKQNCRRCRKI
jgi:acetoacetyl-CoA synthetase